MNLINSISNSYKGNPEFYGEVTAEMDDNIRAKELEEVMTGICDSLAYANYLTENKNIDMELLLQIAAAYLIGVEQGELPEDTPPPSQLFEDNLFPAIRNGAIEATVVKEEEEDGQEEDNSRSDIGTVEDLGTE